MSVCLPQADIVEILTELQRRVVVCEAAASAFNEAATMQPDRLTSIKNLTDDDRDVVKQCLRDNWNAGSSNFCKVCTQQHA